MNFIAMSIGHVPCAARRKLFCALIAGSFMGFGASLASAQSYQGPNMTYSYSGPRITDEDVYRNPDDRMLNLNYARQQTAKGDLLSASSALERILYMEPNWHSARLFYAAVLYRLDDKKAANRELGLLENANMNAEQVAVYEDYLSAFNYAPPVTAQIAVDGTPIKRAADGTYPTVYGADDINDGTPKAASKSGGSFIGRVSAGLRYDDNAGNAITDSSVGLTERGDASVFASGALRVSAPIMQSESVAAFAAVNGQVRSHETYSTADYSTGGMRAGLIFGNGPIKVTTDIRADQINVSGESYLQQTGTRVALTYEMTGEIQLELSAYNYDQDYDNLSYAPSETLRSGDRSLLLATISKRFANDVKLSATIGTENKTSKLRTFNYDAIRLSGSASKMLSNEVELLAYVNLRRLDFTDPLAGSTLTAAGQQDRVNARLAARAPLAKLLSKVSASASAPDNLKIEGAINYNRREIDNGGSDFDNLGVEARLVWDF